jgi:DMSO/TMAO reductase YedYZ molybdopterin-dependent catalytic subunit
VSPPVNGKESLVRRIGIGIAALGAIAALAVVLGAAEAAAPWSIAVRGVRGSSAVSATVTEGTAGSLAAVEMRLEQKGVTKLYRGVPIAKIVGMVDDMDPKTFDRAQWSKGYAVTVTAKDGYAATFDTAAVAPEDVMLALAADGAAISPMIVGNIAKNLWVKDVAEIEIELPAPAAAAADAAPPLVVEAAGTTRQFTRGELAQSPFYVEAVGSYTTSAGTKYTNSYGGVKLAGFLGQFAPVTPDSTVVFVASDGYEMSYPGSQILDASDGDWILAFRMDGQYLPSDPGYFRTVKVGPSKPNIDGHLSVKMVQKVVVKAGKVADFTLSMQGKLDFVLDRQTVMSCVNCHKQAVNYERKGAGVNGTGTPAEAARYEGFPLWRILAYSDDAKYAPHKQDATIISYQRSLAERGYPVEIRAKDGFSITLDAKELNLNQDVILAVRKDGKDLPDAEAPLVLAWDRAAVLLPGGIKPVRQVESIVLKLP